MTGLRQLIALFGAESSHLAARSALQPVFGDALAAQEVTKRGLFVRGKVLYRRRRFLWQDVSWNDARLQVAHSLSNWAGNIHGRVVKVSAKAATSKRESKGLLETFATQSNLRHAVPGNAQDTVIVGGHVDEPSIRNEEVGHAGCAQVDGLFRWLAGAMRKKTLALASDGLEVSLCFAFGAHDPPGFTHEASTTNLSGTVSRTGGMCPGLVRRVIWR